MRDARAGARSARADPELSKATEHSLGIDDIGRGEPALLLLTGWCSSRQRWSRAASLLAAQRRVVNFEWRGHGDSPPATGDFGTSEMVEDALAVVKQTGLETVIPCTASHSGWVAIELRRRLGDRVPAIAHLDWMVTQPSAAYMQLIGELQSEVSWQAARDTLFQIWRGGVESPAIEEALAVMGEHGAEMWIRSGREIEVSYRRHGSPLEALEALESKPVVMHLYGQPPAVEYLEAQQQFADQHDWFTVHRLGCVRTHFSMLEAPEAVAEAIERLAQGQAS